MFNNPIKKRLLINIALLAGVGLLVMVIALSPNQTENRHLFDGIDSDAITKLSIEQPGKPVIVINKINQHWQIIEPLDVSANAFRVNSILNIAQASSYADYALTDIDPVELGLDASSATLFLNDYKIQFGGKDPLNNLRYTQFNERLYLLDDFYLPLLTQSLASFIDTKILPDELSITSYQLPDFKISQTETGGWRIEPEDTELSADALQEWVDRWRKQHASEIVYQPEIMQNNPPQAILQLANGNTIALQIIQSDEWSGLYQATQKIGYKLSVGALEMLLAKPVNQVTDEIAPAA
ncbi:MAG: DUF4340 domain-containing protein [Gammaproteobacteria bacterium]|nr:DUF4340 domain-containing protein [Gammaproteobacteria bacterium]